MTLNNKFIAPLVLSMALGGSSCGVDFDQKNQFTSVEASQILSFTLSSKDQAILEEFGEVKSVEDLNEEQKSRLLKIVRNAANVVHPPRLPIIM